MTWAKVCTSTVSTICCAMIAASIKCLWWHCWVCLRVWGDKHRSGLSWPSDKKARLCWECGISQLRDESANRQESKLYILILEGDCGDVSLFMCFAWWKSGVDKLIGLMCLCKLISCHEYLSSLRVYVCVRDCISTHKVRTNAYLVQNTWLCPCMSALLLCLLASLQLHWGY